MECAGKTQAAGGDVALEPTIVRLQSLPYDPAWLLLLSACFGGRAAAITADGDRHFIRLQSLRAHSLARDFYAVAGSGCEGTAGICSAFATKP